MTEPTVPAATRWLIAAVRRHWIVLTVVSAIVAAATIGYVVSRPDEYRASAMVTLRPKGERPVSAQVVLLTAPRFVAYASSEYTLRRIANEHRLDPDELDRGVNITMAPTTANLEIEVTLADPQQAERAANAIADAVLARADKDPILAAELLSSASAPGSPSGPPRERLLLAGALLALIVGVAAAGITSWWVRPSAAVIPEARMGAEVTPAEEAAAVAGPTTRLSSSPKKQTTTAKPRRSGRAKAGRSA